MSYIPDLDLNPPNPVAEPDLFYRWLIDQFGFVKQPEASNAPALASSVADYGTPYVASGYFKLINGIVMLEGVLLITTALTLPYTLFTLPADYVPMADHKFQSGAIEIDTNGDVKNMAGPTSVNATISLSGIQFRTR